MAASSPEPANKGSAGHPVHERRFEELESRLAFLDHMLEELNSVVVRQDQEIRVLQQQVSGLLDKLNDLGTSVGPEGQSPQHEVPPHY